MSFDKLQNNKNIKPDPDTANNQQNIQVKYLLENIVDCLQSPSRKLPEYLEFIVRFDIVSSQKKAEPGTAPNKRVITILQQNSIDVMDK